MKSIVEDVASAAEWVATALSATGYRADFSPTSLWEIERFFDENSTPGKAKRGGLLAEELGARIFALGSYSGEVVRRAVGGTWRGDDSDPDVEINVQLVLPDDSIVWPVQRVIKRFHHGPEDGIAAWGRALGVETGPPPPRVGTVGRLFRRLTGR